MKQEMPKKQKRDNAYYEQRLKSDFPVIYADLKAGKHKTVTEAVIAAGIRMPRTRLNELKNAFQKASKTEQADFLSWLSSQGFAVSPTAGSTNPSVAVLAINRRLVPAAKKRIGEIISRRGLNIGDVMTEMGFQKLDASLGMAMHRDTRLRPDVIRALEKWLTANASI